MRFRSEWLRKLGGMSASAAVHLWMSTLDYEVVYYDPTSDPAHPDFVGPVIFVFWHEYIPVPFYTRPRSRVALLVSRHADAEWLSQAVRYVGFSTVRGSTARGAAAALRELIEAAREHNLAITPDGPRGPRRQLAQGPVYLSSQLQIPLVLLAAGYDRPWRLPTWDRFAVPRPGTRCRVFVSPRIQIPANLDRYELEAERRRIEQLLNQLTDDAEAWAESGCRHPLGCKVGRSPVGRMQFAASVGGVDADSAVLVTDTTPVARRIA